ncbi:MAG: gamma-glutamyl-gamma-aminobutyrate hydrolase family protein [Chloroflexota bacterium]|nr:gamma-glutamyl-gamma-aminobutyrate hydrolase family protein [Chloroflexota bacterium]
MTKVAITSVDLRNSRRYVEIMESLGAEISLLIPPDDRAVHQILDNIGGLMLTGGPDVDPELYGATADPEASLELCSPLDELELRILDYALDHDIPVLAICRGMQLLNVAFGGQLIQDLPGHKAVRDDGKWQPEKHLIYMAPGAKSAAIIGSAGFFRVNSLHHQGLREAQRSPKLMTSAYSVEDGLIEGLESPNHSWVIGLQCHPERQDEVPRSFANLFAGFYERAEMYLAGKDT